MLSYRSAMGRYLTLLMDGPIVIYTQAKTVTALRVGGGGFLFLECPTLLERHSPHPQQSRHFVLGFMFMSIVLETLIITDTGLLKVSFNGSFHIKKVVSLVPNANKVPSRSPVAS